MPTFKQLILISTLVFTAYTQAKSKFMTAKSFTELQQVVEKLGNKGQKRALIVMDDDDTLTMMSCPNQNDAASCQYLGGPAWFSWQQTLLGTPSHYRVTDDFNQLIDISDMLFAMNYMGYTEQIIPSTLQSLTASGAKLLVLTARGGGTTSATENQLAHLKLNKTDPNSSKFLAFISKNALLGKKSRSSSIASPFKAKNCLANKRSISYQQGVMYVAGQNKGEMLKCLLKQTKSSRIRNIVFIDDTLENVTDINEAFAKDRRYNVTGIHYTALKDHKEALTVGSNSATYQFNAHQRWEAIKATLEQQLQTPAAID